MKSNTKPTATAQPQFFASSKEHMEAVTSISPATRKWLIALGMTQDLRDFCRISKLEEPIEDHDNELLEAIRTVQGIINKYLTEQIQKSIRRGESTAI